MGQSEFRPNVALWFSSRVSLQGFFREEDWISRGALKEHRAQTENRKSCGAQAAVAGFRPGEGSSGPWCSQG